MRPHGGGCTRNASHPPAREPIGEQHSIVIVARGEYEGPALSLCVQTLEEKEGGKGLRLPHCNTSWA